MTNKKTVQEIKDFLKNLQESNSLTLSDDLQNCFTDDELQDLDQDNPGDCFDTLQELLQEGGYFDVEIIYYSTAMTYLKENDPSLKNSLEIAADCGFKLQDLSSETLASLLASQESRENFDELRTEIEDFLTID